MSPAGASLIRNIAFMPCCRSEGAWTTATTKLCAANLSLLRTRKFPLRLSPRTPEPPANRTTDAVGLSGLMTMNVCAAPLGVGIVTSVMFSTCAVMEMSAHVSYESPLAVPSNGSAPAEIRHDAIDEFFEPQIDD